MTHPVNQLLAKFRHCDVPAIGVHHDVSFSEYLTWPALNASLLKKAAKSAAHFLASLEEPDEPSDAMRFGTFAHAGRLEPLAITERFAVMPDLTQGITRADGSPCEKPKATREYKQRVEEWMADHGDKEVVENDWFQALLAMNRRLLEHDRAVAWLNARGPVEVAFVWDDPLTGIRCKARADKLDTAAHRCTDYKTTRDVSDFARQIVLLGYDVQGAFYTDGLNVLTREPWRFGIVAQDNSSPYLVRAAELSETNLLCGYRLMREALGKIIAAVTTGDWRGYDDPDRWERPAWATPEIELEIAGELVNVGEE